MRISIYIIIFIFSLFSFAQAYACSCARGDIWISELFPSEDMLIFEGTPLSTEPSAGMLKLEKALLGPLNRERIDEIVRTYSRKGVFNGTHITEFSVSRIFKGVAPARVIVKHNVQGPSCGIEPKLNQKMLLVAGKAENGIFRTSSCALYRAPEATIRKYFETGKDILLPDRNACYKDIKAAYAKTENLSEMMLKNTSCEIYQKDILSGFKRSECYQDIKAAYRKTKKPSEMKLKDTVCEIYIQDVLSILRR